TPPAPNPPRSATPQSLESQTAKSETTNSSVALVPASDAPIQTPSPTDPASSHTSHTQSNTPSPAHTSPSREGHCAAMSPPAHQRAEPPRWGETPSSPDWLLDVCHRPFDICHLSDPRLPLRFWNLDFLWSLELGRVSR